MKNSKTVAAVAGMLAVCAGLVGGLAPSAHAGADQVYGSMWAWDNNFNNSNIGVSFWSSSYPDMTVSYDFGSGSLYGYPACIRGWHYGWNPANDSKYPAQIKNLSGDTAWYDFSSAGSNMHGDEAYDLFLRNDSSKSSPELEVMIWGRNNSYPIGTKVKSNTVSGQDLWMGYNSSAGYETFSFVPAGTGGGAAWTSISGSIDPNLYTYLTYLCSNYGSYVNTSWYLDVVEAGIEITEGDGYNWEEAGN
jgi:hypothetical protein